MTEKKWIRLFLIMFLSATLILAGAVFFVDPFFHYRAPNGSFYYKLYDQRSQNDGITRNYEYSSIITGTSMAENFLPSEFDRLFGTDTIKVSYSGATYKEINDNLKRAFDSGHKVQYVLRPLDYSLLVRDKDEMRTDMGEYPVWLTNNNLFDDVKYLLNREVIINYTLPCLVNYVRGHAGGHTSFDEYSYTGDDNIYGREQVLVGIRSFDKETESLPVSEKELETVRENVRQNITDLAKEHPETTFLYFYPPYSMAYWGGIRKEGCLEKQLFYIKTATEMIAECDNIHLYGFDFDTEVSGNLDLYRDAGHYCPEINQRIMEAICDNEKEQGSNSFAARLTSDTIAEYHDELYKLLDGYDYNSLLAD